MKAAFHLAPEHPPNVRIRTGVKECDMNVLDAQKDPKRYIAGRIITKKKVPEEIVV